MNLKEDHGLGYSHNVSLPGDENTMNKSTIKPFVEIRDVKQLEYRFKDFKWLANMSGFGVPTDVYYGSILLGVIESQPDRYIIVEVKGPKRNIPVSPTLRWNSFKTKNDAAKMLHLVWAKLKTKDEITDL